MLTNIRVECKDMTVSVTKMNAPSSSITKINLDGALKFGSADTLRLKEVFDALPPASKVLVTLSQYFEMDSSGLGELVASRNKIVENGGQFVLCTACMKDQKVSDLLAVTKLESVLGFKPTEPEAIAALVAA